MVYYFHQEIKQKYVHNQAVYFNFEILFWFWLCVDSSQTLLALGTVHLKQTEWEERAAWADALFG